MKQTVVEQLGIAFRQWQKDWDNFENTGKDKPVSYDEFMKPFLELEKQQQGYIEEEVENILIEYVKTNPTKPYRVISWFREFKNK